MIVKTRGLGVAKTLSLFAVSFLCFAVGSVAIRVQRSPALKATLQKLNSSLDQLNADLKVTYKVTNDARVTIDNINKAAIDERFYFEHQMPVVLGQVQNILGDTDHLLKDVNASQNQLAGQSTELVKTTTSAVKTLGDSASLLNKNLEQLQVEQRHVDDLLTNKDLPETFKNLNTGTAALAGTAQDVQHEVHTLIYPKPIVNVVNWTLKVIHAAGSWIHLN